MMETDRYKKAFDDIRASEKLQMEVLKMTVENKHVKRRMAGKRIAILAAVVVLLVVLGMAAYATAALNGFSLTGGMSKQAVSQMLEEYSPVTAMELIEPDGTVHYLDAQGNETMVLTTEEAAKYEQEQREAKEDAVRRSTTLVDVDSLPVVPKSITELEFDADGGIPDFALGNGHMAIFCGAEKTGCLLEAGDIMTLTMTSNDECHLSYFVIRDGIAFSDGTDPGRVRSHAFYFEAAEPGWYFIGLVYTSASASNLTDGRLLIERANQDEAGATKNG